MIVGSRFWRTQKLNLINASILGLLMLAAPIAVRLNPLESLDPSLFNPQYGLRRGLIIGGLVAAVTSFCLTIRESIKKEWTGTDLIVKVSMASCSVCLGWVLLPYWGISGEFYSHSRVATIAFSEDVMGSGILGIWELGTVPILFVCLTLLQIVIMLNFDLVVRTRAWREGLATLACLATGVSGFLFAPNYWKWFLD